jgi:DNA-binding XRE family transcriptional regulator
MRTMPDRIKSKREQEVQHSTGVDDVPAHIRDLYERQGLSQAAVAERLGVDRSTVVGWMRDWGIPTRDRRATIPATSVTAQ